MRFQPGEGPSRGLLRDCTTSPINRFAALVNTLHTGDGELGGREGARPFCIYTFIRGRKHLKTGDHPAIVSPRAQICLIEAGIPRNLGMLCPISYCYYKYYSGSVCCPTQRWLTKAKPLTLSILPLDCTHTHYPVHDDHFHNS